MCGIYALLNARNISQHAMRKILLEKGKLLRHRGPDWSGIFVIKNDGYCHGLAHERLAIVDPVPTKSF